MNKHELFLKEINEIFEKLRKNKSYKAAGTPNSALKVKCSICGRELEVAHCVYNLETSQFICFRCFEQSNIKYEDYENWLQEFSYDNYF